MNEGSSKRVSLSSQGRTYREKLAENTKIARVNEYLSYRGGLSYRGLELSG